MSRDLTVSSVDRQNILNNSYAVENIQKVIDLPALEFEGERYMTRKQVADFFEIDDSTIDRYLTTNEVELKHNGYEKDGEIHHCRHSPKPDYDRLHACSAGYILFRFQY